MKITKQLTLAAAFVAFAAPQIANAETRSIVLDARGNAVTTIEGACVTHAWPEDNVVCKGKSMNLGVPNVVYFDFAKSSLNAKGKEVVAQAAAGIKELGGDYTVTLSGFADRVDTVAFNQKLSERRAASVKKALVKNGVPSAKIKTAAFGETRNAVPTKDETAEQLNRRVEIEVTR